MTKEVLNFIEHLSDTPWSNYTAADYTVQQWHVACLIHLHNGPPTSKAECKLPVKTPSGVVNKNGVHAAAAALAGARGGVHASSEQKASAARALRGYYKQMNEDPPPSLQQSTSIEDILEHHGVKGMKWGVRNELPSQGLSRRQRRQDKKWQKNIYTIHSAVAIHNRVADKMNNGGLDRLNARHPDAHLDHDTPATRAYIKDYNNLNAQFAEQAVKEVHGTSPSGRFKASLDRSGSDWQVVITSSDAKHAVEVIPTLTMELVVENGKIVLVKNVKEDAMSQSDAFLNDILKHHGVKGMHWGIRNARNRVKVGKKNKRGTARTTYKKSPKRMTTHELETRIKRMETEKKFNDLNKRDVSKGSQIASEILTNSGKKVATTVVTGAALLVVKKGLKKKFGEEAASAITKRGK